MAGTRSSSRAMLLWLALAGVVAVADQLIKQYILGNYRLGDSTTVTSRNMRLMRLVFSTGRATAA